MPMLRARHRSDNDYLEIVGRETIRFTGDGFIANRDLIDNVGMTSLRRAFEHFEYSYGNPHSLRISSVAQSEIDDESQIDETSLVWENKGFSVDFQLFEEEAVDVSLVESLSRGALTPDSETFLEAWSDAYSWGEVVTVRLRLPIARKSVGQVIHRAEEVATIVQHGLNGGRDSLAIPSLVRSGHSRLLIGKYEDEWFDAKSVAYDISTAEDQYELSKDVASFANGSGGLILLGAKTKRTPLGERISKINECDLAHVSVRGYLRVLERRIYPLPEGLKVERVPVTSPGQGLVLIGIPEQDPDSKPFLVSGVKNGSKIREFGITIPTRVGDDTDAPRIDNLHLTLKAGMALAGRDQATRQIRAIEERLEAATWEDWLKDIVIAARARDYEVVRVSENVEFHRPGEDAIRVQRTSHSPAIDAMQRQELLRKFKGRPKSVRVESLDDGTLVLSDPPDQTRLASRD